VCGRMTVIRTGGEGNLERGETTTTADTRERTQGREAAHRSKGGGEKE